MTANEIILNKTIDEMHRHYDMAYTLSISDYNFSTKAKAAEVKKTINDEEWEMHGAASLGVSLLREFEAEEEVKSILKAEEMLYTKFQSLRTMAKAKRV